MSFLTHAVIKVNHASKIGSWWQQSINRTNADILPIGPLGLKLNIYHSKFKYFDCRKCIWNVIYRIPVILFMHQCVNVNIMGKFSYPIWQYELENNALHWISVLYVFMQNNSLTISFNTSPAVAVKVCWNWNISPWLLSPQISHNRGHI